MSATNEPTTTTAEDDLSLEEALISKATTEKKSIIHEVMTFAMTCLGWSPLVVILSVSDKRIALTASAGKFV